MCDSTWAKLPYGARSQHSGCPWVSDCAWKETQGGSGCWQCCSLIWVVVPWAYRIHTYFVHSFTLLKSESNIYLLGQMR